MKGRSCGLFLCLFLGIACFSGYQVLRILHEYRVGADAYFKLEQFASLPPASEETEENRVNINTASASELDALPGIGPVLAQRIIDRRTEQGPFTSVEELLEVDGIGQATLDGLREFITVKETKG